MSGDLVELFKKLRLELKNDLEDSRLKTVEEIKEHFNVIDSRVKVVETKVKQLDREIRKRNVVLFGVSQEYSTYWELEGFVFDFLKEKLEPSLAISDLDFVRRIEKIGNKDRPIIVGFTTFRMKLLVMKNAFKLKETNMVIVDDFPKEVLEIRKKLMSQFRDARKDGKFAILKYDKLIIKEYDTRLASNKRLLSDSPPTAPEQEVRKEKKTLSKKNKTDTDVKSVKTTLERFAFRPRSDSSLSQRDDQESMTTDTPSSVK
ncbi:uncharacterized protein [Rhodnius prolixus]|uniref:uncharacterized protein n=1 Tax=Rhodnius prolixus TaxID=13249 RepID=UPI003D187934